MVRIGSSVKVDRRAGCCFKKEVANEDQEERTVDNSRRALRCLC